MVVVRREGSSRNKRKNMKSSSFGLTTTTTTLVMAVAMTYYCCTLSSSVDAFTIVTSQSSSSSRNEKSKCTIGQQRRKVCQEQQQQQKPRKRQWNDSQTFQESDQGESFALRMSQHQQSEGQHQEEEEDDDHLLSLLDDNDDMTSPNINNNNVDESSNRFQRAAMKRRKFLHGLMTSAAAVATTTTLSTQDGTTADAMELLYPTDLAIGDSKRRNSNINSNSNGVVDVKSGITLDLFNDDRRIAAKKAAVTSSQIAPKKSKRPSNKKDVISSAVWGSALWLLTGSSSNPLVQPLANVIYSTNADDIDQQQQPPQWLKDRNEGLFSPLPITFLLLIGSVFAVLGVLANISVLFLSGDDNITASLQLASVSLIGGGALELGRIATGEKQTTRNEQERETLLQQEFATFAEKRLIEGSNCHKSDVIKSFRRYYAKYRVEDLNVLSNLEVERIARQWNRQQGYEEMTSVGFFKSFQIDAEAEAYLNSSPF